MVKPQTIISYMQNCIVTSGFFSKGMNKSERLLEQKGRDAVIKFLSFADIQIKDIKTETSPVDFSNIKDKDFEELLRKKMVGINEEKVYFGHTVYDETEAIGTQFLDIMRICWNEKLFDYTDSILNTLERGTPLFIDN